MAETTWVRSIYLYVMCLLSFALMGLGAVTAVGGLVHTVAPGLGHRDTLDRVGIGVSNIADEIINLVAQNGIDTQDVEDFCRDVTDGADEFDDCVASETGAEELDAIRDGIGKVRGELESQIRNNAIDQLIRGLLLAGAGLVLLRIHGSRTELFAGGVVPKRTPEPPTAPAAPAAPATPAPTGVAPMAAPLPPPGATPPPPPDPGVPPTASF